MRKLFTVAVLLSTLVPAHTASAAKLQPRRTCYTPINVKVVLRTATCKAAGLSATRVAPVESSVVETTTPATNPPATTPPTPTTSGNAQRLQDEKAAAKAEACALEKEAKFNLDQAAERTRLAGDEMNRLSQELARLTPSSSRYQSVRSAHARAMADFDRHNASKKSWLELTWQAQDVCRSYN
jgi:hypothetical protein